MAWVGREGEKHSVADSLGSGEDLSEVVIYSRLIAMAGAPQAGERAYWFQNTVYMLFDDRTLPRFPTEGVIQVHNLSDVVMFLHLADLMW